MKKVIFAILLLSPNIGFAAQDINIEIDMPKFIGGIISIAGMLIVIAWRFNGRFTKLETSIEWIKEQLTRHDRDIDSIRGAKAFADSHSPWVINTNGEKALQDSGVTDFINNNEIDLTQTIEKLNPDTAYDVQKFAFGILDEKINQNKELLIKIKNYIFHYPKVGDVIIDIDSVVFAGSIKLRDLYLSKHTELKNTTYEPKK